MYIYIHWMRVYRIHIAVSRYIERRDRQKQTRIPTETERYKIEIRETERKSLEVIDPLCRKTVTSRFETACKAGPWLDFQRVPLFPN